MARAPWGGSVLDFLIAEAELTQRIQRLVELGQGLVPSHCDEFVPLLVDLANSLPLCP